MAKRDRNPPKVFFLNEKHELTSVEKPGGGQPPKFGEINWEAKGLRIERSLSGAAKKLKASQDPGAKEHLFLLAKPEKSIPKRSDSAKVPSGKYDEPVQFRSEHSSSFGRLGVDLLRVTDSGDAMVHIKASEVDKLVQTAAVLDELGIREKAKWAPVSSFELIPARLRIDDEWIRSVKKNVAIDSIVEMQPVLSAGEADRILRALVTVMKLKTDEQFVGAGTDFSGRRWVRGRLLPATLEAIADNFSSVQSLHPPHFSIAASKKSKSRQSIRPSHPRPTALDVSRLPTVAVVDLGIPTDHPVLAAFRRGGYLNPDGIGKPYGKHGSLVASRIVFGEQDFSEGIAEPSDASCRFYDINLAEFAGGIHDKSVLPALEAVVATAPDIRVFNLSIGSTRPLSRTSEINRQEELATLRDLENFIFARDVLVVIAAGNTREGITPTEQYPDHYDDPNWGLGHWAMGYNSLTCGAFVSRVTHNGLVARPGWPSPFTCVGPGLADSPVPLFGAPGGNTDTSYKWGGGLGEWCCNDAGLWEDHCGTSVAAPLLAREGAFVLDFLQSVCVPGSRPYACTAKAVLIATASLSCEESRVKKLADRTLGHGRGTASRIRNPKLDSAMFVWQGIIPNRQGKLRINIPVPEDWLKKASTPRARLVIAWDTPVNDAVVDIWACRTVEAQLRLSPDEDSPALRGSRGSHKYLPIIDRIYKLDNYEPVDDLWLIELSYKQQIDHIPTMTFSPELRVGVVVELFDADPTGESPQSFVQALSIAASMNRLSVATTSTAVPLVFRRP